MTKHKSKPVALAFAAALTVPYLQPVAAQTTQAGDSQAGDPQAGDSQAGDSQAGDSQAGDPDTRGGGCRGRERPRIRLGSDRGWP